jgi:integrase
MAGVEIPREWGGEDGGAEKRAMDADQVEKFLGAAQGSRFENLYKIGFQLGFRPGELLALKWDDFSEEERTLRVDQNIVWRTPSERKADPKLSPWYLKTPKTRSSRRTLPLTGALVAVLKAQRRAQNEARLKAGRLWQDFGFIFTDTDGAPFAHWTLRNDCNRILKAAGLPMALSPKSARHTVGSMLMSSGTSPKAVAERLGHATIKTTLMHYSHLMPGEQAEVGEKMERLLKTKK